jgi:uncharacterized damage-inducible protein DinB
VTHSAPRTEALKALLARFADGGPLLVQAVAGLSDEQARTPSAPGAWSIAELVAHLLDSDLVLSDRMKRIIAEPEPTLVPFDEEAWIVRLQSNAMPHEEAAELFAANRRWMARLLASLDEADFARAGIHAQAGRQTLTEIVVKTANHLDHHLKFLYGKRANLGASLYPRYTSNSGI